MRMKALLLVFFLGVIAACSRVEQITPAESRYIFTPQDIEHFPIKNYWQKMAWGDVSYVFFKTYNEKFGFKGLYGTILISPAGAEIKYLCLVNIPSTIEQARDLFSRMVPEPSPRDFGREETIAPGLYQADDVYLYTDDTSYFHLVLRSSRVVYTVLLDGAGLKELQVRNGLRNKLVYIQHHLNTIR